jgi:signal transduction histidine kinase
MGFSLSIRKRIVEAHGGKISVEGYVGKGTSIAITIPTNRASEEEGQVWMNLPKPLSSRATNQHDS